MIKFFRHIRKDLMEQNKTGKYLKYAIGEIVLVVIGILIALSINNWNTERLVMKEEIKILENLKAEYNENLISLNKTIDKRQSQLDAINQIQKIIHNNKDQHQLLLVDSLIAESRFVPTFESRTGVLQEIINAGKLNIIQNKDLKKLLANWSAELDNLIKKEDGLEHVILNNYNTYLMDNYSLRESDFVIANRLFKDDQNIKKDWVSNDSEHSSAINKLLSDSKFESVLSLVNLWAISGQNTSKELIRIIENTASKIEEELSK